MPNLTHTNFFQALKAPVSEALEVARIATDASSGHSPDAYPPILTAAEFAGYLLARLDTTNHDNVSAQDRARKETELTQRINRRLLTWTGEEFFEIVPLPVTSDEDVPVQDFGFRITEQGMRTVDGHLRDHGVNLIGAADRIQRHLSEEKLVGKV